jgi:phosphopantothenoylcysteine decarboxylase/phosphopantothenate--cysteine ligase
VLSGGPPQLDFVENPDILSEIAAGPAPHFCVGFAAETVEPDQDLATLAQAKRERKRVPLLVANICPDTFGRDNNTLLLVDEQGERALPTASKDTLARALVAEIAQRLARPATIHPT